MYYLAKIYQNFAKILNFCNIKKNATNHDLTMKLYFCFSEIFHHIYLEFF